MIYISGRITGNKNWKFDFRLAENQLIEKGYLREHIINPLKLESKMTLAKTWSNYMRNDIRQLVKCDEIYMLKGWRRSKGARLERKIAKGLGMKVIYQKQESIFERR